MSASFALAGLNACTRQPKETIVPYVRQPEEFTPGKPLFFATAMPMSGYAKGLLVESHLGRPTKIEGNPQHPMSMGATDVFAQASLLGLYDPDRSRTVINNGRISAWVKFLSDMAMVREQHTADRGKGLAHSYRAGRIAGAHLATGGVAKAVPRNAVDCLRSH